jgi:long-chain acyl-CoA synthetase
MMVDPYRYVTEAHKKRADEIYGKNIPQLFLEKCTRVPDHVAFRYKDYGIYHDVTWSDYRDKVEAFAYGLMQMGLKPSEKVAIMGDPCFEYFIADIATQCCGAISYGIYTTCSIPEVKYQLEHGDAVLFIAENQEYVDKILTIANELVDLRKIIVGDMRAMFLYNDRRIASFADVLQRGAAARAKKPKLFSSRVKAIKPEDTAVFVYTSGTTGPPKAAMLSHRDLMVGMVHTYLQGYPELNHGEHYVVTHLPLAHLIERSASICLPLIANVVAHIGEDPQDLMGTLREVQPTFFHAVPRIFEKIASQILVGIDRSSFVKRKAFSAAMAIGRRYREAGWAERRADPLVAVLYGLARLLVFRPMLLKVGLQRVKSALTAGGPIPPGVQQLWQIWGVNLRNLYGITEGTLVTCQIGNFPSTGNMGIALYPTEIKLADDGEVLVRGPGTFTGYWKNAKATKEALAGGWLLTGDVAEKNEDGIFRMVDRKKDIMITAGGKNIAPSEIENLVKSSPYISEVVLFADGRKYPAALIEIDFETVSEWARQNGVIYTGYTSLSCHEKVETLIRAEIEKLNRQLAQVEQIKKFCIIPKELDPEDGDTTPTRKIKRKHMYEMFKPLIEGMYQNEEGALFELALKPAERDLLAK